MMLFWERVVGKLVLFVVRGDEVVNDGTGLEKSDARIWVVDGYR
jgi:hypothetical protein